MKALEIIFWIGILLIFYTYIGHGILLILIVKLRRFFVKKTQKKEDYFPPVTLFVAAYNEVNFMDEKIKNCLEIDYPEDKLQFVFVTDGSDDGTPDKLRSFNNSRITVLHEDARGGKIGAINRGMDFVKTPFVVFTDANTYLNKDVIKNIMVHFKDEKVGCVAGEKRIFEKEEDTINSSGEGIYWKYESKLRQLDSELNSVIGAAGELFSIRTELYEHVEKDTLLDDFLISMRIAARGYAVRYEPNAYAYEYASATVKDELKRKIRICAGGIQAIFRLSHILNPFKFGILSWQFLGRKVLRWLITPHFFLPVLLINIVLYSIAPIYQYVLFAQIGMYFWAALGLFFEGQKVGIKGFFVPYYFMVMNYSAIAGMKRFLMGSQSVLWDKAKRAN